MFPLHWETCGNWAKAHWGVTRDEFVIDRLSARLLDTELNASTERHLSSLQFHLSRKKQNLINYANEHNLNPKPMSYIP